MMIVVTNSSLEMKIDKKPIFDIYQSYERDLFDDSPNCIFKVISFSNTILLFSLSQYIFELVANENQGLTEA